VQFSVSNYIGPYLTDILSSLAAIVTLIVLLQFWRPTDQPVVSARGPRLPTSPLLVAWSPYLLLVICVLLSGYEPIKAILNRATMIIPWPGLDGQIQRLPPVVGKASPYAAKFTLNILSASGTATMLATIAAALVLRIPAGKVFSSIGNTAKDLALPTVTIACVLALAFVMNYSGATATLGLAFAATGVMFPFFSALVGWLGVFLTGSDTSSNALFGNLQVVTANQLGLSPALMAASNSSGGVMGKMISLQNIAVAAAATGMSREDEAKLFRFTLKHSIFLASVIGLVVMIYAYLLKAWSV
jgi:lactate permease